MENLWTIKENLWKTYGFPEKSDLESEPYGTLRSFFTENNNTECQYNPNFAGCKAQSCYFESPYVAAKPRRRAHRLPCELRQLEAARHQRRRNGPGAAWLTGKGWTFQQVHRGVLLSEIGKPAVLHNKNVNDKECDNYTLIRGNSRPKNGFAICLGVSHCWVHTWWKSMNNYTVIIGTTLFIDVAAVATSWSLQVELGATPYSLRTKVARDEHQQHEHQQHCANRCKVQGPCQMFLGSNWFLTVWPSGSVSCRDSVPSEVQH